MKYLLSISFVLLLLSDTVSAQEKEPPMSEEERARGAANMNQHIAISITLARLYCKQHAWPKSLEEIKQFLESNPMPMPVEINWAWLAQPAIVAEFGDQIILKTPKGEEPGNISVTSTNSRPECKRNEINPKVHIHLGG